MFIVCCIVFRSNVSGSYGHADCLLHSLSIKRIRELWEESGSYGKNPGAMGMVIVFCIIFRSNKSGSYGNVINLWHNVTL